MISGYYGGRLDNLIMRIVDIFMSFPYMVLAIAIVAITKAGINALFISMWLVGWKEYTRLVRSETIVVKQQEYVEAARVLGYSDLRIILRNILPNVLSSSIVYGASDIVMCMLSRRGHELSWSRRSGANVGVGSHYLRGKNLFIPGLVVILISWIIPDDFRPWLQSDRRRSVGLLRAKRR